MAANNSNTISPIQQNDTVFPSRLHSHSHETFITYPWSLVVVTYSHHIAQANDCFADLLGYPKHVLAGTHLRNIFCDKATYNQIADHLSSPETTKKNSFKTAMLKKNGTQISVAITSCKLPEKEGEETNYLLHVDDCTACEKLKQELRKKEITLRTIADFTYDWELWVLPDKTVQHVSPSCERITGYSAAEFKKDPYLIDKITHKDDRKAWSHHRAENDLKIDRRELQFRIIRKDGEVRWIEHACQAVIDGDGTFKGYRSTNRDITVRKNFEEELRNALFEIELYKDQLEAESAYLKEEIKLAYDHENIVGSSNSLKYVLFKIEQVASSDTTVLLLGETGTGKELFARTIHSTSNRGDKPLVKINCAALPPDLVESELFGHEKGAFTNASSRRIGRFELADQATIFLDEIGDLPLELQAKLLRVLQEGEFERIGGNETHKVDVRVIAATNRDLEQDVQEGKFRKDLWYRLNVFPITAPPLRDRTEDIPQLVNHFMDIFTRKQKKHILRIPEKVLDHLKQYPWPGNVRELENIIERAVITTTGSTLHLAEDLAHPAHTNDCVTNFQSLDELERNHILTVLEHTNWKVSGKNSAAEILGLKRSTLRARMDKHNIRKP